MDDAALAWGYFEQASQLHRMELGEDRCDDGCIVVDLQDEETCSRTWEQGQTGSFVPLPDGDFHVCLGVNCPFATIDRMRNIFCTLTGHFVANQAEREHDATWTGRSTTSSNPDDHAGVPQGGWAKRRDSYQV